MFICSSSYVRYATVRYATLQFAANVKRSACERQEESPPRLHFAAIPLAAAANRRMGKHYKMVSQILSDLEKLDQYSALKVEFLKVGVKKADLRAAVHRAAQKKNVPSATSSDEKYLYVFRHQTRNTA